jgi:hypothetical protein
MNKTLHQNFSSKAHLSHNFFKSITGADDLVTRHREEMRILREAANDLLQPRPQAIAQLLKMGKEMS